LLEKLIGGLIGHVFGKGDRRDLVGPKTPKKAFFFRGGSEEVRRRLGSEKKARGFFKRHRQNVAVQSVGTPSGHSQKTLMPKVNPIKRANG
jgi:hypothetical protein